MFGKNLEIFEKIFLSENVAQCRKMQKRGPFLISKHAFCCKITKNSKGGSFGDIKKFSKKSRTVPKKNQKGDPLASAGFVGYVKKVKKNERGTLWRKKIFEKKTRTVPKKMRKNSKGGTL